MDSPFSLTKKLTLAFRACAACALVTLLACGDGGGGGVGSNTAEFSFDCSLNGLSGALVLQVEAVEASGITWGNGPNPDITGVIGTGEYTYYTTGSLTLPDRVYMIDGANQFADLWSNIPGDRLVVEWQLFDGGLTMVWDWFGAAFPVPCQMTNSRFL
ncbi:MAG: hypothetical protein AAF997_08850 [Myxococcota bacterium]